MILRQNRIDLVFLFDRRPTKSQTPRQSTALQRLRWHQGRSIAADRLNTKDSIAVSIARSLPRNQGS
jgi:hypothetical protein